MRCESCDSNIKPDKHNVNIEASVQPLSQWKSSKCYIFWVAVLVALVIQNIKRKRHIIIWGLPKSIEFFHNKGLDFRQNIIEQKMCVLIFCTNFVWNISHPKKKWETMIANVYRISFKVSTGFSCHILKKLEFSGQRFEKHWNIEFN